MQPREWSTLPPARGVAKSGGGGTIVRKRVKPVPKSFRLHKKNAPRNPRRVR